MVALYTLTIAAGAALLFILEPMFARQILPLLGGSPAVWNTAMVFFQAALLAAYAYAHASTARWGVRRQSAAHLIVIALAFLVLPIAVPAGWTPPTHATPVWWVLGLLTVAVGLPFFAIATTSPLLQRWFSATLHPRSGDPYFLYAASNAGSLLGLLSYPLWIEPHFRLSQQARLWSWGYALVGGLIAACAVTVWRSPAAPVVGSDAPADAPRPGARRRILWLALAFVPSSLMLGVTTYLSSEVAVVPLLWIVPLALYLLTFVAAFARRRLIPAAALARAFPLLAVIWVLVVDMFVTHPIGGLMALHLAVFVVIALLCHGRLAEDRPSAANLTEFYLWVSVGGMLGGIFNALLAPLVFSSVAEYPIALTLACWLALRPPATTASGSKPGPAWRAGDILWPVLLGAVTWVALVLLRHSRFGDDARPTALVFGAAAILCYLASKRPARFAAAVGALLLVGHFSPGDEGRVLSAKRSFFGVHRVMLDPTGRYHVLLNGVTIHGRQAVVGPHRDTPLSYYHPSGPAGDVLAAYGRTSPENVAVVGLGAGSLASYARPGQQWTYFEIDPVVEQLARDRRYFTFLADSAAPMHVVLGDARQSLTRVPDGAYDLLILDAYSSDAIPVHLVTREALALYLRKLAPHGRLLFHISNVHLDLEPVFANLAHDAHLACLTRDDTRLSAPEIALGKSPSQWLVMARTAADLERLASTPGWRPARVDSTQRVWSDDYSSILTVMRWQ
ncbi:MAG TPA: fused MFS/spermidine synthase [Opitutaceae bacterium]|nr:fused MFS/spermidine synthase [Opitutaceae bacterium]